MRVLPMLKARHYAEAVLPDIAATVKYRLAPEKAWLAAPKLMRTALTHHRSSAVGRKAVEAGSVLTGYEHS